MREICKHKMREHGEQNKECKVSRLESQIPHPSRKPVPQFWGWHLKKAVFIFYCCSIQHSSFSLSTNSENLTFVFTSFQ